VACTRAFAFLEWPALAERRLVQPARLERLLLDPKPRRSSGSSPRTCSMNRSASSRRTTPRTRRLAGVARESVVDDAVTITCARLSRSAKSRGSTGGSTVCSFGAFPTHLTRITIRIPLYDCGWLAGGGCPDCGRSYFFVRFAFSTRRDADSTTLQGTTS
jgi:hypothetical protein